MDVVGSKFDGAGRPGDFRWMIEQPDYARALFIFNDNEEQFLAYRRDPTGRAGSSAGGGNAAIRPFRGSDPPRAAGIPTGRHGRGYDALTPAVQEVIDDALAVVRDLLATGKYEQVVYSAGAADGDLGTGIFQVGEDVRRHIVAQLQALAT